jgi:hypothetical protein
MSRNLHFIAIFALGVAVCVPGHSQDSPSLGDLARKAQKDKATTPATAKVITNEDLPPGSGFGGSGSAPGMGRVVQPGNGSSRPGAAAQGPSSSEELGRMEGLLDQLASLDRTALANNVLQGSGTNFPGRDKWEQKLFAAKQLFVTQGRMILKKADQLQESAKTVQDVENPNDPRAKDLATKLQQLMQQAEQSSAAFQAVIAEGKDLAGQSAPH